MAETLIALLLVSGSAGGPNLVFCWPPSPKVLPRLARPRPTHQTNLDNPWRAFHSPVGNPSNASEFAVHDDGEEDYEWKTPQAMRDRSRSFPNSASITPSTVSSPTQDGAYDLSRADGGDFTDQDDYKHLLGYSAKFLAGLLCPSPTMCHQKFELIVDDLVFIGHPVCVDEKGVWRFKGPNTASDGRGRGRQGEGAAGQSEGGDEEPENAMSSLQTFHFVIVLDLPDPSSSAIGNVAKYFDVIYEQIAFTFSAVLFQEQVISNFVEQECEQLSALKEQCITYASEFEGYIEEALHKSSIASAMKSLFEAITSSSIAYITINNLPLELQLPPYLDKLLHYDEITDDLPRGAEDDDEPNYWGTELSFAWRLPTLAPWKSLLLLDSQDDPGLAPYMNLRGPHVHEEDRQLAEGLLKFLEVAEITLSLAEMATGLEWDLETQVYPTVRWLVQHRRAKVVDVVHAKLKTPFSLPARFDRPIGDLASEFESTFSGRGPSLLELLATISASTHRHTENHFFATVVREQVIAQSKDHELELVKLFLEIVKWMLQRDLLVRLHLRIRVIVTPELKARVRADRERAKTRKVMTHALGARGRRGVQARATVSEGVKSDADGLSSTGEDNTGEGIFFPFSPRSARMRTRRLSSIGSSSKQLAALRPVESEADVRYADEDDDEDDDDDDDWDDDTLADNPLDDERSTLISDPSQATPLERRWLSAMCEGKDPTLKSRFNQINQYFDGRKADDEILYRANITRKQLREVLHAYDEYLETFLHS